MARQNLSSTLQLSAKARRFLNITATADLFKVAADAREQEALKIATDTSRAVFTSQLSGRPLAPARLGGRFGRPTTNGQFASDIQWIAKGAEDVEIGVDTPRLPVQYYLIQEIGTGQSAEILDLGATLTVKSQMGRTISTSLVFADSIGGQATNAKTGFGNQQLFLRSDVNGVAVLKGRKPVIRKEIKGKHYLREGGIQGFRTLDSGLRADAKRIFQ